MITILILSKSNAANLSDYGYAQAITITFWKPMPLRERNRARLARRRRILLQTAELAKEP